MLAAGMNELLDPITWLMPFAVSLVALVVAEVSPVWLGWWYWLLLRIENVTSETVTKPIGGCAMCTAGLWTMITSVFLDPINIIGHLTSASLAILLGACLTKLYQWTQR